MEKDVINDLFKNLKGEFDIQTPGEGHELRFAEKLKSQSLASEGSERDSRTNWKHFLAIAATLVLCFSVFMIIQNEPEQYDLASVSPEMSKTQDFFTVTLETELKKLNNERSPLTEDIINDALKQIKVLEEDYLNLKKDLSESGQDERVIYAMIRNFQNRIDILTTVLEQIEIIKSLKINTNETTNTI